MMSCYVNFALAIMKYMNVILIDYSTLLSHSLNLLSSLCTTQSVQHPYEFYTHTHTHTHTSYIVSIVNLLSTQILSIL